MLVKGGTGGYSLLKRIHQEQAYNPNKTTHNKTTWELVQYNGDVLPI